MKILVLGAGRMGHGAAYDLVHNSPDVTQVTVADFDLKKAEAVADSVGTAKINARHLDAANQSDAAQMMDGHDSAISCVNYWYNESLLESRDRDRHEFLRSRWEQLRRRCTTRARCRSKSSRHQHYP